MNPAPRSRDARAGRRVVLVAAAAALGLSARAARADEIRVFDPNTCEVVVEKASEVGAETWTEISYKSKAGGPLKKLRTPLVLEIVRGTGDDPATKQFSSAMEDLDHGQYEAARDAFAAIGGGGPREDKEKGVTNWVPFNGNDNAGKPKWHAEYGHFFFVKAAYLAGKTARDKAKGKTSLEWARKALEANETKSTEKDKPPEKGFLERFKDGKSRWYAEALALKGQILTELGEYDEATKAFDALYAIAIDKPIGGQWAFEAKIGPGRIAEAKNNDSDAIAAYEAAAAALESLIPSAPDTCSRRQMGKYYMEARSEKARLMLRAAEKQNSPPAYAALQKYLEDMTPEALRKKFAKSPPEILDAILAGAMSPAVQAVVQNGIGLSQLMNKQWVEAVVTFTGVRVKYFSVAEQVPRALSNLVKAAEGAAAAATRPDAKKIFQDQAKAARDELAGPWKDTEWARNVPPPPK